MLTRGHLAGLILGTALAGANALAQEGVAALWELNCLSCHGNRGQGGGAGTRTLLTDDLYDQKHDRPFFNIIRDGDKDSGMPGFRNSLNDAQVWGLVVHIRELQLRNLRKRGGPLVAPEVKDGVANARDTSFKIVPVVESGLDVPWAVDFLPTAKAGEQAPMLITERPGGVRLFQDGKLGQSLTGLPAVRNQGQGGMMDVAVHPDYATNGWIYLAFSHGRNSVEDAEGMRQGMTKVVRGKIKGNAWVSQETIFEARKEHYLATGLHFGSRIVFTEPQSGGKRYIYFSIGERGREQLAQDLSRPNGKVFRVWEDGSVPTDNPFVGQDIGGAKAYDEVWSYGHRNPQGLTMGLDGTLWDTEHGPRGGDEVNVIEKGRNYGWPLVAHSINYSGTPFKTPWLMDESAATEANIKMPAFRWLPSTGACGLDVIRGPMFAAWKGDLIAGGLAGQNVDRIRMKDGEMVEREELVFDRGRVRDVVCGPEGAIYVVLNDPDSVIKLVETTK